MIDELYEEGIPREKTLDLDEKMHGFAQALLKSQFVMLRRGGGRGRMGHAVHAVLGMGVHRRHGRVLGILPEALKMLHVTDRHFDDLRLFDSAPTLLQVFRRYESAEVGQAVVHTISSALLDDPV